MEKTRIIYVKLSNEQSKEVKKLNKLKKKMEPTHAIVWVGHGQIFGDEKHISNHWLTWTKELSEKEKEKQTTLRDTFSECIKDDSYQFDSYVEKDFRDEMTKLAKKKAKEFSDQRIGMVKDEYEKILERIKEEDAINPPKTNKIKNILLFIVVVIFVASMIRAIS